MRLLSTRVEMPPRFRPMPKGRQIGQCLTHKPKPDDNLIFSLLHFQLYTFIIQNANHRLDVVAYPRVHESLTGDGPEHIIPYNGNLSLLQSDVLSETENVVQKYGFAVVISE